MGFRIGDHVGDYRIVGVVGSGGAGQVFRVEHRITGRVEAMKTLLHGRTASEAAAQRFQREIKLQASLSHPNIASVHNAFWSGDELVMIMELVEGRSLDQLIAAGPVRPIEVLRCALQCLDALEYAHARHITHRDIKPENVMVTPEGVVKLMDFGLAKLRQDDSLTQPGAVVGSLYYISPEQAQGSAQADHRADIYSFGAVLYELVTGKRPFQYNNSYALLKAAVHEHPLPPRQLQPRLPEAMEDAILCAMDKDPEKRFQSAGELRARLETIARNPVAPAAGRSRRVENVDRMPSSVRRARRQRLWMQAAMLAICLLLLGWWAMESMWDTAAARQVRDYQEAADGAPAAQSGGRFTGFERRASEYFGFDIDKLAVGNSGAWVAAAAGPNAVELWRVGHRGPRLTLAGLNRPVVDVTFSADERLVATAGEDGAVQVWETSSGKQTAQFKHAGRVTSLAFSASRPWLASGSADGSVRIWDLTEPETSFGFEGPAEGPVSMIFSPTGPLLAGAADEKKVRLWSAGQGRPRAELEGLAGTARSLAFSANGLQLAAVGGGRLTVWDMPTRSRKRSVAAPADARAVVQSGDGRWMVLSMSPRRSKGVDVWDPENSSRLATLEHDERVRTATLSADGSTIVTATEGGQVVVWTTPERLAAAR